MAMNKYAIRVDLIKYGTAYYTVCAENEDAAVEAYKQGNANYVDSAWGDSYEEDVNEVEAIECDGCDDCEEDDDAPDPCPTCKYRVNDGEYGVKCNKGNGYEQAKEECNYYEEGDPDCDDCIHRDGDKCTHDDYDSSWNLRLCTTRGRYA